MNRYQRAIFKSKALERRRATVRGLAGRTWAGVSRLLSVMRGKVHMYNISYTPKILQAYFIPPTNRSTGSRSLNPIEWLWRLLMQFLSVLRSIHSANKLVRYVCEPHLQSQADQFGQHKRTTPKAQCLAQCQAILIDTTNNL